MDFETWKEFYDWGMATKEQLREAVEQGMLTQEQYNDILGIKPTATVAPTPEVKEPVSQVQPTDSTTIEPKVETTEPVQPQQPVNASQDVKPEETETKKNIQAEQPIVTQ
ncbi:MAG: XkdX family protein [Clostridium sp.]|uniref:XkdX family protein n=1 Tax=Clostridium sp. TaxID=1506 RepID=UPI003EE4D878